MGEVVRAAYPKCALKPETNKLCDTPSRRVVSRSEPNTALGIGLTNRGCPIAGNCKQTGRLGDHVLI